MPYKVSLTFICRPPPYQDMGEDGGLCMARILDLPDRRGRSARGIKWIGGESWGGLYIHEKREQGAAAVREIIHRPSLYDPYRFHPWVKGGRLLFAFSEWHSPL